MNDMFSVSEILKASGGEAHAISDMNLGVQGISTDSRESLSGKLFIALSGEKYDAHEYLADAVRNGAVLLCVEKSKMEKLPDGVPAVLVTSTLKALQDIAHFHRMRFPDLHVIALTGSCGKTSTKETLRAIFQHAFGNETVLYTEGNTNNQIGVPQNLLRLTEKHRYAIIEMGTNSPGEIEMLARCAEPDSAMIVSIGNCHLEKLKSLYGVAYEKSHIFTAMRESGKGKFAVIPRVSPENSVLCENASSSAEHVLTFGASGSDADYQAEYAGGNLHGSSFRLFCKSSGETFSVNWNVPGKHQAENAAGAAAMAACYGIPFSAIAEGIQKTVLPGMRMKISEVRGATLINDAYNANPDSMKASLEWISEFADQKKLLLVLGDMGEIGENSLSEHKKLVRYAVSAFPHAEFVFVGKQMMRAVEEENTDGEKLHVCSDSQTAASLISADIVKPGITIFLKASRSTHLERIEQELNQI